MKRENLYVKLSKCEFGKTSLNYLGYIVGGGELKIDPSKVEVIVNLPKPKSATEVRSFLGATQYWRILLLTFLIEQGVSVGRQIAESLRHLERKN